MNDLNKEADDLKLSLGTSQDMLEIRIKTIEAMRRFKRIGKKETLTVCRTIEVKRS